MASNPQGYSQVQNIIRRAQALILNVKLLGADVTVAKEHLANAKNALDRKEYETALQHAMASLKEVMRLKKAQEVAKASGETPTVGILAPDRVDIPIAEPAGKPLAGVDEISDARPSVPPPREASPAVPAEPAPDITRGGNAAPAADEEKEGMILGHEFYDGFSYLIEEGRANKCFEIFHQLVEKNYTGLCITRTNPKLIKNHYNLQNSEMMWLTDRESSVEPTIQPSLENMIYVAEEFIDNNEKPVMLLDGLEYLVNNNTFNSVLRFIRRLIDKISESEAILLIGVSQLAVREQELKLLEKEMTPIIVQ
ncbi:MAG: DUF835 domain-containing protein [Thermoplasmata archaeon]|nr:MAG: DUF835 domain-containing protein [Thermoplasmata archaeon]